MMEAKDFDDIRIKIKEIIERPDDVNFSDIANMAAREREINEIIFGVIRKNILGRFELFGGYTQKDYEDAMQDLNEVLELIHK